MENLQKVTRTQEIFGVIYSRGPINGAEDLDGDHSNETKK